jgi:hypothetical protein
MPNVKELKDKIPREAHESAYSIHLGGNKIYHDLKAICCWYRMKRCCLLRHLPESQNRASTTHWIAATLASARVEVGRDCCEFHHGIAYDSIWI